MKKIASNRTQNVSTFFWPHTLTVSSFVTSWPRRSYSTSLESPYKYLISNFKTYGVASLYCALFSIKRTPLYFITCKKVGLIWMKAYIYNSFGQIYFTWALIDVLLILVHLLCIWKKKSLYTCSELQNHSKRHT